VEVAQLRAALTEATLKGKEEAHRAFEAGRGAGEAAAKERLEAQVRSLAGRLGEAVSDIAHTRAEVLRGAEAEIMRLAIEIARRILHREMSTDPFALEGLLKAALEKLHAREVYRVRVHPAQEPLVKACLEQSDRFRGVLVVADPSQPEGGALFEVAGGILDASVETQVCQVERALMNQIESRA
jgi:flagellar assembly protein FliH